LLNILFRLKFKWISWILEKYLKRLSGNFDFWIAPNIENGKDWIHGAIGIIFVIYKTTSKEVECISFYSLSIVEIGDLFNVEIYNDIVYSSAKYSLKK